MHMYDCERAGQRLTLGVVPQPPTFFSEARSLAEHGEHWFGSTGWPADRGILLFLPLQLLRSKAHAHRSDLLCGMGVQTQALLSTWQAVHRLSHLSPAQQ